MLLSPPAQRTDALSTLALVAAVLALLNAWNQVKHSTARDFYQFWLVGQEIRAHDAKAIYSDAFRHRAGEVYFEKAQASGASDFIVAASFRRTLETYSTPWMYSFFRIIGSGDFSRSLLIYKLLLLTSAIGGIAILCRVLGYSTSAALLIMAVVLGWGQAFRDEADCLNVDQIQLLGVAILASIQLSRPSRIGDVVAGVWMASLVLFKPNLLAIPVLLAASWLFEGRRRRLIWQAGAFALAAVVIVCATSAWFHSARIWIDWIGAMRELDRNFGAAGSGSSSLRAIVTTSYGASEGWLVAIGVPVIALVAVVMSGHRIGKLQSEDSSPDQSIRTLCLIALGCAVPLLSGTLAWMHYFALSTPLLLVSLRPGQSSNPRDWFVARCIVGAIAILMMSQPELISQGIWLGDPLASAQRLNGATLALFVLGLLELQRIGNARDPGLRSDVSLSGESEHVATNIR